MYDYGPRKDEGQNIESQINTSAILGQGVPVKRADGAVLGGPVQSRLPAPRKSGSAFLVDTDRQTLALLPTTSDHILASNS